MRVDLHFHSCHSDGTATPAQLVKMGVNAGLKVMALTDHDTVSGVPDFLAACDHYGMRCLTGIEMSASWPGTLHLVGLGFRIDNPQLQKDFDYLASSRVRRNERIFERLHELGMPLTREEVEVEAKGGVIGRPHFAKALVKKGWASHLRDAFKRFLGQGGSCYFTKESFPPEKCIAMIRAAGGRVSLAHPYQTSDLKGLKKLVPELKAMGLWGLECFSGHHTIHDALHLVELARSLDLEITAGSDYHGANREGFQLGIEVPDEYISWRALGFAE